jgi:hypothetical protein
MQHRGFVCATLLFLVAALVLPAAPAAAEPGLVRVPEVLAGLWDLFGLSGDPAPDPDAGVRSTGAELELSLDWVALTQPLGEDGDGSQTTEVLDPDATRTEQGRGFNPDG